MPLYIMNKLKDVLRRRLRINFHALAFELVKIHWYSFISNFLKYRPQEIKGCLRDPTADVCLTDWSSWEYIKDIEDFCHWIFIFFVNSFNICMILNILFPRRVQLKKIFFYFVFFIAYIVLNLTDLIFDYSILFLSVFSFELVMYFGLPLFIVKRFG